MNLRFGAEFSVTARGIRLEEGRLIVRQDGLEDSSFAADTRVTSTSASTMLWREELPAVWIPMPATADSVRYLCSRLRKGKPAPLDRHAEAVTMTPRRGTPKSPPVAAYPITVALMYVVVFGGVLVVLSLLGRVWWLAASTTLVVLAAGAVIRRLNPSAPTGMVDTHVSINPNRLRIRLGQTACWLPVDELHQHESNSVIVLHCRSRSWLVVATPAVRRVLDDVPPFPGTERPFRAR